ncbi:hypothetical protein CLOM_g8933 [Closterium sp. NIES-68]|nr:hypothetical protein CLOM_g8933 [Closterium sp. NIES-68]
MLHIFFHASLDSCPPSALSQVRHEFLSPHSRFQTPWVQNILLKINYCAVTEVNTALVCKFFSETKFSHFGEEARVVFSMVGTSRVADLTP